MDERVRRITVDHVACQTSRGRGLHTACIGVLGGNPSSHHHASEASQTEISPLCEPGREERKQAVFEGRGSNADRHQNARFWTD